VCGHLEDVSDLRWRNGDGVSVVEDFSVRRSQLHATTRRLAEPASKREEKMRDNPIKQRLSDGGSA
jgi:hypothetical protein